MSSSGRRRLPRKANNSNNSRSGGLFGLRSTPRYFLSPLVARLEDVDCYSNPPWGEFTAIGRRQGALVLNPPQPAAVPNPPQPAAVQNPPQPALYEKLKNHFNKYDTGGNGRLSEHELRRAFADLGSGFPLVRVFSALEEADKDKDGCIGPEEWDALIQHTMTWYSENSTQT